MSDKEGLEQLKASDIVDPNRNIHKGPNKIVTISMVLSLLAAVHLILENIKGDSSPQNDSINERFIIKEDNRLISASSDTIKNYKEVSFFDFMAGPSWRSDTESFINEGELPLLPPGFSGYCDYTPYVASALTNDLYARVHGAQAGQQWSYEFTQACQTGELPSINKEYRFYCDKVLVEADEPTIKLFSKVHGSDASKIWLTQGAENCQNGKLGPQSRTDQIFVNSGDVESSNTIISEVFPEDIQRWNDLLQKVGKEYNLDPNLLAIIMFIESSGNEYAMGASGEYGLFQVMPYHFSNGDVMFDPYTNASAASKYIVNIINSIMQNDPSITDPSKVRIEDIVFRYNAGITGGSRPIEQLPLSTQKYGIRAGAIYDDIQAGLTKSPTIDEIKRERGIK